jgi:hypothetical protein
MGDKARKIMQGRTRAFSMNKGNDYAHKPELD